MKTERLLGTLTLLGAAVIYSGCFAHAQTGGYVEVEAPVVFVEPPPLVEIDVGVWVVRDYDYPVYYVDNAYWEYREDVWFRSDAPAHGWSRVDVQVVPVVVVGRTHSSYVHYHGAANARTRVGPMGPEMRPAARSEPDPRPRSEHGRARPQEQREPDGAQPGHGRGRGQPNGKKPKRHPRH